MTNHNREAAILRQRLAEVLGERDAERRHSVHLGGILAKALNYVEIFHGDLADRKGTRLYEVDLLVAHGRKLLEDQPATIRSTP